MSGDHLETAYMSLCAYDGNQPYQIILASLTCIEYICGSPVKVATASLRRNARLLDDPNRRDRFQESLHFLGSYIRRINSPPAGIGDIASQREGRACAG